VTELSWSSVPAAQGRHRRGRVTSCPSQPWWIAQLRAGLYRGRCVVGPAPARPAQIDGQVAGCRGPASPRSAAVDPGPGGRLAVTKLLARVGGSSVTANCPCAAQGGCLVDMALGADHRGRACVAVWWGEGPSSPLTALRHQPDHGWRSCWTRPTAWRRGRCVQAQRAPQPPSVAQPGGLGHAAGVGAIPARPRRAVRCWKGRVVRLRAATPRSVLAWRPAAAKPQPLAHRSDQPRLGLSSCEGSCSRPGPRPGTTPMSRRVRGVRPATEQSVGGRRHHWRPSALLVARRRATGCSDDGAVRDVMAVSGHLPSAREDLRRSLPTWVPERRARSAGGRAARSSM
jgi:hypothetical protein